MNDIASIWMEKVKTSNCTAVTFVDWDDTLIARVPIPKELRGEERLVYLNDYVRNNLIHPDLRRVDVTSRRREDTYRGRWPYLHEATTFRADGKLRPEDQPKEYTRADGGQYPLTNKLDYKLVTGRMVEQPDGTVQIQDDPTDPYPYLRGFIMLSSGAAKPWTTFGSGELGKYSHRDPDGTVRHYEGGIGLVKTEHPDGMVEEVERITPTPTPAPAFRDDYNPDELVTMEEQEYIRLCAIRDRWEAAADMRAEFCMTFNAETVEEAAAAATAEELLEWGEKVISAVDFYWGGTQRYVLKELAARVVMQDMARQQKPTEEV